MKNKKSKIVKQLAGDLIFLASDLKTIEPLHLSLFNWAGTSDELRDMGDSKGFSWFSIQKDKYLRARANNFITHKEKYFGNKNKGLSGGLWKQALKLAQQELDSYKEEVFIVYHPQCQVSPYSLGNLLPNDNDEIYSTNKNPIHVNIHELEKPEVLLDDE